MNKERTAVVLEEPVERPPVSSCQDRMFDSQAANHRRVHNRDHSRALNLLIRTVLLPVLIEIHEAFH